METLHFVRTTFEIKLEGEDDRIAHFYLCAHEKVSALQHYISKTVHALVCLLEMGSYFLIQESDNESIAGKVLKNIHSLSGSHQG